MLVDEVKEEYREEYRGTRRVLVTVNLMPLVMLTA